MQEMEVCAATVAIGGDKRNTVPKIGLTVSEIAVLRELHGESAVFDVKVTGTIERSSRQELARLRDRYTRINDGERKAPEVDKLFPGASARVFMTLDELDLGEEFMATIPAPREPAAVRQLTEDEVRADLGKKKRDELVQMAEERGFEFEGNPTKAEIIDMLLAPGATETPDESRGGNILE